MALLETDPQDVLLAPDGDIWLDADGLRFVAGVDAVVQAVRFRLLLFRAEWFMNEDIGVPYFEELIGDASKRAGVKDRARAAFGAAILDAPGVVTILKLDVDIVGRAMTVTWQAQCAFGDTPVVTLEVPGG